MGWNKDNDCCCCEVCVNCGRKDDYYYADCDKCGEVQDKDNPIYDFDGEMLCRECILKLLLEDGEIVKSDDGYVWDEEFFEDKESLFLIFAENFEVVER